MSHNLLEAPIFSVDLGPHGHQSLSLPALLSELGGDTVRAMHGVQAHQRDAVHIFLCYLAASVLEKEGLDDPAQSVGIWRNGLRSLTAGLEDHAWSLVVDDWTQPAFMQPAVAGKAEEPEYKDRGAAADGIDVLQTAKNHDLKSARITRPEPEDWVYALISVQTMSGFMGAGNYGVSRMNSGSGSRPCVGVTHSPFPGARWRDDTLSLVKLLDQLLSPPWPYSADGQRLLWTLPWDGKQSLGLDTVHPFFIEVARPIRLRATSGVVTAFSRPTKAPRIAAKELKGNTGDPWTPINRRTGGALTVPESGFTPRLLRDLLLDQEKYSPAPLQKIEKSDGPCWLHASVLVRGQGTTGGFHEARVRIAPKAIPLLMGGQGRERLSELSEWALERSGEVQNRILKPALLALLEGGPARIDYGKREISGWIDPFLTRYADQWNAEYFGWLWGTIDQSDVNAKTLWQERLKYHAEKVLEQAIAATPQRAGRRYRARVKARQVFHGSWQRRVTKPGETNDPA